jgi:thiamine-phosphate pyrophosphorylase
MLQLAVISSAVSLDDEVQEVIKMFEAGLECFHIRKPNMSKKEMAIFIKQFPKRYRKRLVLHGYHALADQFQLGGIHLSRHHRKRGRFYHFKIWLKKKLYPEMILTRTFHKLTDITSDKRKYTYAFLSPLFDSVSQSTLAGGFSKRALLIMIPQAKQPIYALGGITTERLRDISDLGFHGAALHGHLWEDATESPSEIFIKALAEARAIKTFHSEV